MPSTGRPAASSTGTITMIEPAGMPGTEKVVSTTVSTMVASCAGASVTPYSRAMKTTPIVSPSAPPTRKVEAASGRKNDVTCWGSRRRERELSIMAGSAASDERALKATACAEKLPRAKSASDIRPPTAAIG